ncbi:MAG TPA: hypothetical protein VI653_30455 [Steroidobacteraceae bacterium]
MGAAETLQARRAALLLHGLSPQQRSLVMAKLGTAEKSRLEPMLEELTRIGIPGELARGTTHTIFKETPPRELSPVQRASQLDVESVLRALDTSAPGTIGHFLRSYDWPWKVQLLERLPEPRRSRALDEVQARMRPLAPAALAFLATRLCAEAERVTALPQLNPGSRLSPPYTSSRGGNRWRSDPWHNAGSSVRARFKRWVGWAR